MTEREGGGNGGDNGEEGTRSEPQEVPRVDPPEREIVTKRERGPSESNDDDDDD